MAEHATLKKALRQMAEGSRSAFHTFYLGSSQYIYSSALLLYDSHEDACRFMVDFYQYLYLHLPEYDRSENLEGWISRLLVERYEQLSIGKNMSKPSARQQMNSTTVLLSKNEQERIWRMLDVNIHFPKEPARRSPRRTALLISVLLLLLLLANRYVPAILERLQTAGIPAAGSGNVSGTASGSEGENTKAPDTGAEDAEQADEPDSIEKELDDLLSERTNADAGSATDDTDALQQQQSGIAGDSDLTKAPAEPAAPREPDQPQEPQTPEAPAMSENSDTLSNTEDLENLELELRYGDSLRFY